MNCIDYQELISAEIDGELAPLEAEVLEGHLASCSTCRKVREDFRVNQLLVRAMAPVKAPADGWPNLVQALSARDALEPLPLMAVPDEGAPASRKDAGPEARALPRRRRWMTALKVAACLAVMFVGFLYWLGATDSEQAGPAVRVPRVAATIPVRTLVRGHAWLQVDNPVADRSAWHYYMASDGESGDDHRTRPGHAEYQSAGGEVR